RAQRQRGPRALGADVPPPRARRRLSGWRERAYPCRVSAVRNGVRGLVGGLAATALAALLAGPAAAEMTLEAPDCVGNAGNVKTLQMKASGFMPGSLVSVRYEASYLGEPRSAALLTADATGTIK